jgi:anti-sigma28 factor (negative regulator of flagellin synthesis)
MIPDINTKIFPVIDANMLENMDLTFFPIMNMNMPIPSINIPSMNTNTNFFQGINRMFQNMNDKIFKYINTKILLRYSKKHRFNILYITGGVAVSSALFYYLYSNFPQISMDMFRSKDDSTDDSTDKNKQGKDTSGVEVESYENKYYDKYDEMESEDLDEEYVKTLKNNVLYEMTPKGRIIMYYDFEKESFIYYCDTKDVPYLYLETVARKYALTYHCKKIVVDIKRELDAAKETNIANDNKSKAQALVDAKKTDNLFASFKSYNRKGTGGSKTMNKKFILRQNANRYSYSGKVNTYSFLKRNEYKIEKPMDKMDYETFKKLMAKKN